MRRLAAFVLLVATNAGADEPMHVVVRVSNDAERAILKRVVGQAADLDVAIEAADEPAIESTLREQLDAADAIAAKKHARVVIWFEEGKDVIVALSEPHSSRVLVRSVPGNASSSATLESVALVVRGALRALASGGTIGVERQSLLPPEPPPPKAAVVRPVRSPAGAFFVFGAQLASDGEPALNGSVLVEIGARLRAWDLAAHATFGFPTDAASDLGTIHFTRHAIAGSASYAIASARSWRLGLGIESGVMFFLRSTRNPSALVRAEKASVDPAFLVGPAATLHLRLFGWIGAAIAVGADIVPFGPDEGWVVDGAYRQAFSPWVLMPWGRLGIEIFD